MFKEFINFIKTGNVIEFAVAVILAGAVSAVVNGFVNEIMMPVIGMLTGGMDFSEFKIVLQAAATAADGSEVPEVAIRYGAWINSIINLLIIGWVLFMIIRSYNKLKKPQAAVPSGPTQEELLTEIRDLLKKS